MFMFINKKIKILLSIVADICLLSLTWKGFYFYLLFLLKTKNRNIVVNSRTNPMDK